MPERFFTVVTRDERSVIERYLYDHSTIEAESEQAINGTTRRFCLIRTEAEPESHAQYLAQYQADRLASGLHGTSPVAVTREDATAWLHERWAVTL